MNSLLSKLVDPAHAVRRLCIKGLGNVASAGGHKVRLTTCSYDKYFLDTMTFCSLVGLCLRDFYASFLGHMYSDRSIISDSKCRILAFSCRILKADFSLIKSQNPPQKNEGWFIFLYHFLPE